MKRRIFIFLTIGALVAGLVGCGNSMTTIRARKEPTRTETTIQASLAEGISLYRSGDYVKSEESLRMAVERDSTDWQAHRYLGLVRLELGEYRSASEQLLRSLDLAPDDALSRAGLYAALGECWENLKESGKARLHYHTALNLWPQCAQAREGLARLASVSEAGGR